jgi:hypothetical protein
VLCSAGGGLWGSRDGGATWAPLTDQHPTLVMGAVAQAPSAPNVMYAATGDGDSQLPYGVGLLRSADAGTSWSHVPCAGLTGICAYDLAVDPADALRVFIASTAALHVSTDGGKTVRTAIADHCWSVSINPATVAGVSAASACPAAARRRRLRGSKSATPRRNPTSSSLPAAWATAPCCGEGRRLAALSSPNMCRPA